MKSWTRVRANMSLGAYEVIGGHWRQYPRAEWPELPFKDIYRIAFKDKIIRSLDHPVVKRLRGGVAGVDALDLLPHPYVVAIDFEFHFGGHATPDRRRPLRRAAAPGLHGGAGIT